MFKNLSRQLKQSTSRIRHQLADKADGETTTPSPETETLATTNGDEQARPAVGQKNDPVSIQSRANGDYEITNPATGKTIVLSRQSDPNAPLPEVNSAELLPESESSMDLASSQAVL